MPTDYKAIADANTLYYGTGINEYGPKLLSGLYDKRTHFVFELLQNAEDAIRKREGDGPRSVHFDLRKDGLFLTHFGKPFDEPDIIGICGIDQSTKEKDLTAIGRFGIGFKSVFAFTSRPEICSDDESFAIDEFVHPVAIPRRHVEPGQTMFWFPFRADGEKAFREIAACLAGLNARTLMFLREIRDVSWRVEGGASGTYCRESEPLSKSARKVTLIGQQEDTQTAQESWLVFSRPVFHNGIGVGSVELAFWLQSGDEEDAETIQPVADSRLVAFFPTNVATKLGFLLQAPFRTTPARDNVPVEDEWNQHLIEEASTLLVESLDELKGMGKLTVDALGALPLVREQFSGTMFEPMFEAVSKALAAHPLLPTNGDLRVSTRRAVIARGQELRELVNSKQLTDLLGQGDRLHWLSDEITNDRTPTLRTYLMKEHGVREVSPEVFLTRVTPDFLKAQSDDWIRRLYRFLNGQPYLFRQNASIRNKPWVRLEDGTHVVAYDGEQPNAFLPSKQGKSGFPTVRLEVCRGDDAREFLKGLKLTEPDPVDDVVKNILPRYEDPQDGYDLDAYRDDVAAIVAAYATQRRDQREKLIAALRPCRWVLSRTLGNGRTWCQASECYLPTERLTQLFEGVAGVRFLDNSVPALHGEAVRDVLLACGAGRYLETVPTTDELSYEEKEALREQYGDSRYTGTYDPIDRCVRGLIPLLALIESLSADEASARAVVLWQALGDLVQDKRASVVKATYAWYYYSRREMEHDAAFIRRLQKAKWIPSEGSLVCPTDAVFEEIEPSWTPNAVLQAALKFKPPIITMIASQLGVDREAVMALADATPEEIAELKAMVAARRAANSTTPTDEGAQPTDDTEGTDGTDTNQNGGTGTGEGQRGGGGGGTGGSRQHRESRNGDTPDHHTGGGTQAGRRPFISYVATRPVEEQDEDVSDSSTQEERMRVEAAAIDHILQLEPDLHRTEAGNPGFDLYGTNAEGETNKWVEVKAMVGTLDNHAVAMSRRQFLTAQEKSTAYWLYVVESATSDAPRILRIQDPAGNARSFTFDQGWREIAMAIQINMTTGEIVEQD